jgi:hypothetical protein
VVFKGENNGWEDPLATQMNYHLLLKLSTVLSCKLTKVAKKILNENYFLGLLGIYIYR